MSEPGGIVIGGDFQGLGIVRSLGRAGIKTCVIDDQLSIARVSRFTTHHVRVPDLRNERKAVDALLKTGRRLGLEGWILYPTRDETVAALARNKEELSQYFRVPTPSWESVRCGYDKRNTYRKAEELGIPTPRTWFPTHVDELEAIDAGPPWVIKPAIKENFVYATKEKAWLARNRDELRVLFSRAQKLVPVGEMMVQELIPGGSEEIFGYCGFFKQGAALGTMITQYRRQHPILFGRSCTSVHTVHEPALEEMGEKFLRGIDYYGLAEIEFKRDVRDGHYKLIDANTRTWGYHSLGNVAGVNFPLMLYYDQIGKEVEVAKARAGASWLRLITDLPVGLVSILRRQVSFSAYVHTLLNRDVEAVYSWEDPLPGLLETALLLYFFIKKGY